MTGHEREAAEAQDLWRTINESIKDVHDGYAADGSRVYLCECSNTSCHIGLELAPEEYERIRADGTRFVVGPGDEHVDPEVEIVAAREQRYWVVEKIGEAAEVAAHLDPRA